MLEIVENFDGDIYHAVYSVRFQEAVYVLYCFQEKATLVVATPRTDLDLVTTRLKTAETEHEIRLQENPPPPPPPPPKRVARRKR